MLYMTLKEVVQVCAGAYTFSSEKEEQTVVIGGVTDNRKVEPGNLFFAIRGERVDGHRFAQQAIDAGASAVIAERPLPEVTGPVIVVESTTQALSRIAAAYRQRFSIPVVGITGSVGKTSTKEMISSILSEKYQVLKTDGNFNNEIGMPLTLLRVREEHEAAVVEMGINHFGEMDRMSQVCRPDLFVITNIGECHLEFLGDRDGVLRAKTEGFNHMKPGTCVVLNGEDDKLITLQDDPRIRPVYYRVKEDPAGRTAAGRDAAAGQMSAGEQVYAPGRTAADRDAAAGQMSAVGQMFAAGAVTSGQIAPGTHGEDGMISCESAEGISCADITNFYMEGIVQAVSKRTDQTQEKAAEGAVYADAARGPGEGGASEAGPVCAVYADDVRSRGEDGTDFTLHAESEVRQVHLHVPGIHMVRNALAGACIARELGLSMDEIVRGIEKMHTISGRSNFIHGKGGVTIIDDCYNANPTSTKASLEMLAGCGGRKIAVLGDMGELGANEVRMHREVGAYAASLKLDALFTCGRLSQALAQAAAEYTAERLPMICWFAEKAELKSELVSFLRPGDTVLIKASHFMGFEEIVKSLQE